MDSLAVSSEDQRWLAVVAAVTWSDCQANTRFAPFSQLCAYQR